ncbi:hypothetical protein P4E94_18920 [Pontiellaceae bacterium B12219]|nr:hypothetical protein [Pontiellaceae bacterium B12219]
MPSKLYLLCVIGVCVALNGFSSGYRPPFDRALEQAELVVQGEVVDAWNALGGEELDHFPKERAYRMVVNKCFKGALKAGDEVYFWDPHYRSTASYGVRRLGEYICYLVPAKMKEFEKARLTPQGKRFYKPIRVRKKRSALDNPLSSSNDYFTPELQLLDLFVENKPANKCAAYRDLLESQANPYLLFYVIKDWPRPLSDRDILLFKQHMQDASDPSASYVRQMAYALSEAEASLTDLQLLDQLSRGGPLFLPTFRDQINGDNIELLQSLLFKWVLELDAGGEFPAVIQTLAEHAPDFFMDKLREKELQEWKLIASLSALGINGEAVGKAEYPPEIFSIYPSTLRNILSLREGDLFHARLALTSPSRHTEWKKALPLLEPMLSETNSAARRLCVALFRTFGVPVEREGEGYVARYADAPQACPVRLNLSMERTTFRMGEEIRYKLTETAVENGTDFCFEGEPVATLHFVDNWISSQSVPAAIWENTERPREAYVGLDGQALHEEELTVFRSIERPGIYRISFSKCYPHDGGEHGLDAWTGMAFAENELVFTVE